MRDSRRFVFPLFCVCVICVSSVWGAVRIPPDLRSILASSAPSTEIPVIVVLSEQVELSGITDDDKALRRARIIHELKDKAEKTQGPLKAFLKTQGSKRIIPFWVINAVAVTLPAARVNGLAAFPGLASISLDYRIEAPPITVEAFGAAPPEWNITATRVPELWSMGFTGSGVVVANTDTGVDLFHPDLAGKWRGGTTELV